MSLSLLPFCSFFFNDTATTEIYTLSLHELFRSDDVHQRRLAAARVTHDRHVFAAIDRQADATEGRHRDVAELVGLMDIAKIDHGRSLAPDTGCSSDRLQRRTPGLWLRAVISGRADLA